METDKVIIGIDPGTTAMGYGILHIRDRNPELIAIGVLELHKFNDHYIKLQTIFERTLNLIDRYHPDELAIEAPFYGKNVQSMLKLGRAQGAAISAALFRSVPIFEYAPRKVKLAITGNGNASKEQVASILQSILKIKETHTSFDATDGLAVAVCHYFQKKIPGAGKNYKGWKEFIEKNPGRIQ
ncbi:MAG: crossover junction endodeoxyribonuclease RuvC [Bacteroidetes bacterium]|nr:crossover junction endodeoxyribonuclease RuvC [Bacteroidota bacterium]